MNIELDVIELRQKADRTRISEQPSLQCESLDQLDQLNGLIELMDQPLEKQFKVAKPVNCEVMHSVEDFQTIEEIWEQFNVNPLNSYSWNLCWWKAFQDQGDLHLIKFESAGEVIGIAPFYTDRWFGLSRFRFLATGNTCTDYVDLICDPLHYDTCAESLAAYIRDQAFSVVELDSPKDDRLATLLKQHLVKDYRPDHRPAEPTWRLALPSSWDEFKSVAKKSLRRKINKAVRRFDSEEFSVTSSHEIPVDEAFETLKELHTLRFNSKGKPGVFADPQFERFLRSAISEFHRQGKSEIVIVLHKDSPIAAHLYFNSSDGYQFYQSGYDPKAMKLEPGHLLFTAMIKKAIDRGDAFFDFLRGDEPYKGYWGASPHDQRKLRLVSKKVLPTVVANVVTTTRRTLRKNS